MSPDTRELQVRRRMDHRACMTGPLPQSVSLVYTSSAGALYVGWSRLDPCPTCGRTRYLRWRAEATSAPSSPGPPGSVVRGLGDRCGRRGGGIHGRDLCCPLDFSNPIHQHLSQSQAS